MFCPSCHTPNRDNAKFCKKCGLPFVSEIDDNLPVSAQSEVATLAAAPPTPAESSSASTPSAAQVPAENELEKEEAAAPDALPSHDVSTQNTIVDQMASASPPSPSSERSGGEEDIALAPTQILSPEKMMAYQTRRWQQEMGLDRQQGRDVAELPTVMIGPVGGSPFKDAALPVTPAARVQSGPAQPDIADMPTVLITPGEIAPPPSEPQNVVPGTPSNGDAATIKAQTPSAGETGAAADTQEKTQAKTQAETQRSGTASSSHEAVPSPTSEEDAMEHVSSTDNQSPQDSVSQQPDQQVPPPPPETAGAGASPAPGTTEPEAFTTLAVGTLVADRYEVAQVLSEDPAEYVYSVTDHQGYQHCWNCGSEENAEGDEFCITCGAELLNASYIMHEYPPNASGDSESHVLHGTIVNTFVDGGRTYVIEQPQATQNAFPNGVHLTVASDSDAGDVRRSEPNEDSTLILQLQRVHESLSTPIGIFVVADGMGGHDAGQLASRMAIGSISERLVREMIMPPLTAEKTAEESAVQDEDSLVEMLHGAVEDANTAICQTNQQKKTDMGSTITGFMIAGDLAYIFNVGDSRTYMQRDGKLYQLTNDHSLVGQLVAGGLIEPDDVYTHPQRSQIYRSLGDKLNVQIDIFKQQVTPGDILLSCSDGLWEMVRNPQITEILNNAPDPQTACARLIEAANTNGGEDNVSAVVVFVR
jgi:serine/threonine protein phosphatase PrpC